MILAELVDVAVTEQIDATVANVDRSHITVVDRDGGEGRAHAAQLRNDHGHVVELVIGIAGSAHETLRLRHARRQLAKRAHEAEHRALAGQLASFEGRHAIRHCHESAALALYVLAAVVFVVAALATGVA